MTKAKVAATAAPSQPVAVYAITAKGSNAKLKEGTYAVGAAADGNKGSLIAIAAIGPTFTLAQMQEVCKARNHPLFVSYAIRRGWVAQVQS